MHVFFEAVVDVRKAKFVIIDLVTLLDRSNDDCCIHFCDQLIELNLVLLVIWKEIKVRDEALDVEKPALLLVKVPQNKAIIKGRSIALLRVSGHC
jgi:hypothetical protein